MEKQISLQMQFDYLLQGILFVGSYQHPEELNKIAAFVEKCEGDLLEVINEAMDTYFTWEMLKFIDDEHYLQMNTMMKTLTHQLCIELIKANDPNKLEKMLEEICLHLLDRDLHDIIEDFIHGDH